MQYKLYDKLFKPDIGPGLLNPVLLFISRIITGERQDKLWSVCLLCLLNVIVGEVDSLIIAWVVWFIYFFLVVLIIFSPVLMVIMVVFLHFVCRLV